MRAQNPKKDQPVFAEVLNHLWGNVDDSETMEGLLQDIALNGPNENTSRSIQTLLQRAERELIAERSQAA